MHGVIKHIELVFKLQYHTANAKMFIQKHPKLQPISFQINVNYDKNSFKGKTLHSVQPLLIP